MALYLVRQLTSSDLLQRLKTIGVKHPELCKALGEWKGLQALLCLLGPPARVCSDRCGERRKARLGSSSWPLPWGFRPWSVGTEHDEQQDGGTQVMALFF